MTIENGKSEESNSEPSTTGNGSTSPPAETLSVDSPEGLTDAIARKRAAIAPEIARLELHRQTFGGLANGHIESPEATAERERLQAMEALRQQKANRTAHWEAVMRRRGERYARCTLDNFETKTPEQQVVVGKLREYAEALPQRITHKTPSGEEVRGDGGGVILLGPPGTGKDHLLAGLVLVAIGRHGWSVVWENGEDLFGEIRDQMNEGAKRTEADLISRLAHPSVLVLSDPLPPFGQLTEFQARMLFRVIDARYSRCRPTWVTMNVANRADAEARMGPQVVDRLLHNSLSLWCYWPSFRR